MRIAALGDLHCGRGGLEASVAALSSRLAHARDDADLLLLAGDLTDGGEPAQARALGELLARLGVPHMVAVLGNHDHDHEHAAEVTAILREHGVTVLDGALHIATVRGERVAIAGAKGFCGGFGKRRVGMFGEPMMKAFVAEADRETEALAAALAASDGASRRIALLHYAPVHETLIGESPELYPFLGNSDLADAIDAARVDVAVHGHAHFGRLEGKTAGGCPVFNVALPLLERARRPYLRIDLDRLGELPVR